MNLPCVICFSVFVHYHYHYQAVRHSTSNKI